MPDDFWKISREGATLDASSIRIFTMTGINRKSYFQTFSCLVSRCLLTSYWSLQRCSGEVKKQDWQEKHCFSFSFRKSLLFSLKNVRPIKVFKNQSHTLKQFLNTSRIPPLNNACLSLALYRDSTKANKSLKKRTVWEKLLYILRNTK